MSTPSWNAARSFSIRAFSLSEVTSHPMNWSNPFATMVTCFSMSMVPAVTGAAPRGMNEVTPSPAKALSTCSTTVEDAKAVVFSIPWSWTLDKSHPFGFAPQIIQNA